METNSGIIVRIVKNRGFGFILRDDGKEIYFHAIGVLSPAFSELRQGMPVEFFVKETNKGPEAIGVVAV